MTKTEIREERRQKSQARKRRRRTLYMAGGSLLALLFILSFTLGPGLVRNNQSSDVTGLNFGGPVEIDPDYGATHIAVASAHADYAMRPATSGPHWQARTTTVDGVSAPAKWDVYEVALPDEILLHNLEHGGIGLHYDCPDGCPELVAQLESLVPRNRAQFIVAPYPTMESKIAITAWRHHLFLDEFDEAAINEFIDEYQDRAPESVPGNLY
jgi:hypothetical protein